MQGKLAIALDVHIGLGFHESLNTVELPLHDIQIDSGH